MKDKILEILRDSNDFVSGQELCRKLGVSRTAVWKNINSLKQAGYVIEGVNNKGYRLVSEPDVMSEENIRKYMAPDSMIKRIFYYDETDSTNIRAKIAGETDGQDGDLFVADCQVSGRGRRGRGWTTDSKTAIAMTFLLKPPVEITTASRLTLVAALAIARALEQVEGIKPQIKWPNDIVIGGKKICGILTEMSSEGEDIKYVVVGIGINIYNREFPDELKDRATSIFLENGRGADRSKIVACVANEFERLYRMFCENQDLGFMVDEYNEMLVNLNRKVYVIENEEKTEYTSLGLSPDGGLKVRDIDGKESEIISGEVSVRGIYGYV